MIITSLCDNLALPGFDAEHGMSLYIQSGDKTVLFDFGASCLYAENARKLGIDLNNVNFAFLSHGHYDHGGGLGHFLTVNPHAPVYISPYAFEDHRNRSGKFIGLAPIHSPRLKTEGCPGAFDSLWQGKYPLDTAGMACNGETEDFRHEQYLLFVEQGKRILFSGCSHKGILNIMEHFRPDVLVGGFHFKDLQDEKELAGTAKALLSYPCRYITCHCTGEKQYEILKKHMGDKLHWLRAGEHITL